MALAILDGTQTATTLSTILSSGQHITAHTVVSLGAQAITDMQSAVSGSVVSISNFPASQSTTFGAVTGSVSVLNFPTSQAVTFTDASLTNTQLRASALTVGGAVTIGAGTAQIGSVTASLASGQSIYVSQPPSAYSRLSVQLVDSSGTGNYGTDGSALKVSGTVTLGAGTAQIGSVTASISGTVPISISSITIGNSVTIGSLPAISGTVTANGYNYEESIYEALPLRNDFNDNRYIPIGSSNRASPPDGSPIPIINESGGFIYTSAFQSTAVTTSNFTSITPSTVLASFNASREVLTIFNEGAGNLHVCAGATCTTIAYQVRLSSGDYYEVPNHQTTITHSAVFATTGTARVTEVS